MPVVFGIGAAGEPSGAGGDRAGAGAGPRAPMSPDCHYAGTAGSVILGGVLPQGLTATCRPAAAVREEDLQQWKLLERFRAALAEQVHRAGGLTGTWADPRRQTQLADYLSLYLFGLFNPVVRTMRGLCEASALPRVQAEVCSRPVSLGSFSEAQAVVDAELLRALFAELAAASRPDASRLAGLTGRELVVDSTVWQVLPRMAWAFWRAHSSSPACGPDHAVRLHVHFDLARLQVRRAELTPAKVCEREAWERMARSGELYIGDRYYSYDYSKLGRLQQREVDFIVRLRLDTQWVVEQEEPLTAADAAAGAIWAGTVRLGKAGEGPRVRVIRLLGQEENILLATTLAAAVAAPELLALLYRHRWQVELFFRWLKCILGCRHWLAESPRGVALQVYLALIAAQLLVLYGGQRPNRRQMEAIQFYLMGWCDERQLLAQLQRGAPKAKKA